MESEKCSPTAWSCANKAAQPQLGMSVCLSVCLCVLVRRNGKIVSHEWLSWRSLIGSLVFGALSQMITIHLGGHSLQCVLD